MKQMSSFIFKVILIKYLKIIGSTNRESCIGSVRLSKRPEAPPAETFAENRTFSDLLLRKLMHLPVVSRRETESFWGEFRP